MPIALIVCEGSDYKFLEDYILAAGGGKKVFFGSCGNGTPTHLAGEMMINHAAGINLVHVLYAGCSQGLNAVMANQVESALVPASSALAQINSGKIRILAVTSKERSGLLPNESSISELGYDVNQWHGLLASSGTPMVAKERIAAEIQSILESGELLKRMQQLGYTIGGEGSRVFDMIVKGDIRRYKDFLDSAVELVSD